jgi:hypothetical protein
MKTFTKLNTLTEIKEIILNREGWEINTKRYDAGFDHVLIKFPEGHCLFNTFNGHFFGLNKNERFTHADTHLDDQPWFNELLETFYK